MAKNDEMAAWKDRAKRAEANLAAALKELERHRHGQTIESDFICPDSVALTEARNDLLRLSESAANVIVGCLLNLSKISDLQFEMIKGLELIGQASKLARQIHTAPEEKH